MSLVIHLTHDRSTKNYHVYHDQEGKIINDPYIRKDDIEVDGKVPKKLKVTIEEEQ